MNNSQSKYVYSRLGIPSSGRDRLTLPNKIYLEKVIIHQPVDLADLPSIPTTDLDIGVLVPIKDTKVFKQWDGVDWVDYNVAIAKLSPVIITESDSPYSAVINQMIIADTTDGDITITLPDTTGIEGESIEISVKDNGSVTIQPSGSDTIIDNNEIILDGNSNSIILTANTGDWRIF